MNNQRKQRLTKAIELLQEAQQIIEEVRREEEDAFDKLPFVLQCFHEEDTTEVINNLEEAYDGIDDIISSVKAAEE